MNELAHTGKAIPSAAHASLRRSTAQGRKEIVAELTAQAKWYRSKGFDDRADQCLADAKAVIS